MNTDIHQILVRDHVRALHAEAEAARLSTIARRASEARSHGHPGPTGWRPGFVRRVVARLAGA
jgi:hypothetical protein